MIKTLIRLRLRELGHQMTKRTIAGGKGKAMKILFAVLMAYCAVVFLGMFGGMFYLMCEPFAQLQLSWLYFAMAGILAAMLCFIGSIFFTQSLIFESHDNELLLSMPIKPSAILFSRVGTLLVINLGYSLIITLPCIVVWVWLQSFDALLVLRFIVCALLLPVLPTALSCLVGFVIALISSRMRSKNLVSLVLSGAAMAAYFYVCFNAQELLMRLLQNGEALAAAIEKVLPPFYALGMAVEGNLLQLLFWVLWCLIPMALVYALLSKAFLHIATMKRGAKKVKYKGGEQTSSSAMWALTRKEMRRYTCNAMYTLNGAIGTIMSVLLSVMLLVKRDLVHVILSQFAITGLPLETWLGGIMCAMLCLLTSMNMLSAASISIEGKNLWLMQSLPLPAGRILLPKALAQMVICVPPALIAGAVMAFAIRADAVTALAVVMLPGLVAVFMALFGVVLNLLLPRFDYAGDVMAIKSGMSSGLTMFGGMGIVALPVIVYALIFKGGISLSFVYLGYGILLALGCFLLYYYLTRGAQKRFANLGQ